MKEITKKFVFEEKLKGNAIYIYVNEITDEEIQCLIDCGILRQFTPKAPRRVKDLALAIAQYPIINGIPVYPIVLGATSTEHIYSHVSLESGDYVKLRDKSLISKET